MSLNVMDHFLGNVFSWTAIIIIIVVCSPILYSLYVLIHDSFFPGKVAAAQKRVHKWNSILEIELFYMTKKEQFLTAYDNVNVSAKMSLLNHLEQEYKDESLNFMQETKKIISPSLNDLAELEKLQNLTTKVEELTRTLEKEYQEWQRYYEKHRLAESDKGRE